MNAIKTKKLTKHFSGIKAVNELSISAKKGKVTSLIGPNGSGKTTLINLLSGVSEASSGEILIFDQPSDSSRPHSFHFQGVTRTFQNIKTIEQATVIENFLLAATTKDMFRSLMPMEKDLITRAENILLHVGLEEKKESLAQDLSYGQRKLLEIGRCLMTEAEVFLFDEPFAGLFPEMIEKVKTIFRELLKENKTIILIEHNMDIVRELSDHIIVIDEGKLLSRGDKEQVLNQEKVKNAYLG